MPEIKVAHVVSFSSEDKNHPAQNLLKPEGTSKWRSGAVGEQNVTCILQLEKAVKVSQVDIGNEGAAFVEVLVGRSSGAESDFQVLLVSSSFMNPADSRNGQNLNRVRIFTADKLNATLLDQKWDRVKVVCSQPFNKSTKYGLSFIKLHSPSDGTEAHHKEQTSLGGFKLKTDEPAAELKVGSLFANRHKEEAAPTKPLTGAAAVRAASKHVEEERKSTVPKTSSTPGAPSRRDSQTASTSATPPATKRKHDDHKTGAEPGDKKAQGSRSDRGDRPEKPAMSRHSNSTESSTSSKSRTGSPPPSKKSKPVRPDDGATRPLKTLMKKVVFVLSGYQNPERGDIRDRALEMGATYCPGWGPGCTHLVCAFSNTPKFSEVRKKGRIVTSQWVTESHKRRKLLPWRKYRLGNAPTPPGSSGSEDESVPQTHKETSERQPAKGGANRSQPTPTEELDSDDPVLYEGSTDDDGDTEDEIDRVRAAATWKDAAPRAPIPNTPVIELDSSSSDGEDGELPELPDFFSGKHFLLYGSLPSTLRRTLLRFIIAYNGKVENYMNDGVHYVISNNSWDENFDDALSENPNLAFVRPNWIMACNDKQRLVPHQKYVIVPAC